MEFCSAIKKNEILPFEVAWMNLEIIIIIITLPILDEVSQKEKDKYHVIALTCGN